MNCRECGFAQCFCSRPASVRPNMVRLETAEKYRAMYDGLVASLQRWCDEHQAVDFGHEPWFVRELRTFIPDSVTNADPRASAWWEGWSAGIDHAVGLASEDNPYGD